MTFVHDTICPSCNSSELVEVGGIPSGCYFAGNLISEPMEPSSLFECATCHLFSRIPRLNKLELDELYISALGRDWYSEDKDRTDFTLICSLVELNYPKGGRVLDVGCFDGALLGLLGNAFDKYGIELNSKARALAEERGVSVLGENFDALTSAQEKFDVVLAVDVIEHVHDPFDFMKDLLNVTKSDGLVVVSTGNTDSTSWRFLKS